MEADKIITEEKAITNREATGEFAVRGAMIKCQFGHGFDVINLPLCHGVYSGENPLLNIGDMVVGKNIDGFGMCIVGNQEFVCKDFIAINDEWMNLDETKLKIEGKEALLCGAQNGCSGKGGIITITHSGQNAEYIKAAEAQSEVIKAAVTAAKNVAMKSAEDLAQSEAIKVATVQGEAIKAKSDSKILAPVSPIAYRAQPVQVSRGQVRAYPTSTNRSTAQAGADNLDQNEVASASTKELSNISESGMSGASDAVIRGGIIGATIGAGVIAVPDDVGEGTGNVEDRFNYVWTGEYVTNEFKGKVVEISDRLEMNPDDLMGIMAFESWIDPTTVNSIGATGLIQFMPSTAKWLGTSTDELVKMSAIDQLDYVEKYFKSFTGNLKDISDAYMTVLLPVAVGKDRDFALGVKDSKEIFFGKITYGQFYKNNSGLDYNGDGKITKWEATKKVIERRDTYKKK